MIEQPEISGIGILLTLGFLLLIIVLAVMIWWKIFAKAGYGGAMGLLMFVPLVNIIVLLMLAFSEWPIQREINMLRQQMGGQPQTYYPPQQNYPPQQAYYPPPTQNYPPQQNYPPPQGYYQQPPDNRRL